MKGMKRQFTSPKKRGTIMSVTEDGYHVGWRVIDSKNESHENDDDRSDLDRQCRKAMEIPPRWGRGMRKQGEALQQLLQVLMNLLVKKDTNKWFSVPMNDRIAPGYSDKVK